MRSRQNWVPLLPLYLAEYGALCTGMVAVWAATGDAEFARSGAVLAAFAVGCGFALRMVGVHGKTAAWLLGTVLFLLILFPETRGATIRVLVPGHMRDMKDLGVAVLMLWLALGVAAVGASNGVVPFVTVPLLTVFGLLAPLQASDRFYAALLLYVLLSLFLLSYENVLTQSSGAQAGSVGPVARGEAEDEPPHRWLERTPWLVRMVVLASCLFFLALFLIGTGGSQVLLVVTPSKFAKSLPSAPGLAELAFSSRSIFWTFGNRFTVGSSLTAPSEQPVVTVTAQGDLRHQPLLWRVAVYDHYDGKAWERSKGLSPEAIVIPAGKVSDFWGVARDLPTGPRQVWQRYDFAEGSYPSSMLPALAVPVRLTWSDEPPVVRMDQSGCLKLSGWKLVHGYEALSAAADPSSAELDSIPQQAMNAAVAANANYLQTPVSFWRGEILVNDIIQGATTPYRKAMAIRSYLEKNYVYSLTIPSEGTGDPTVEFLTTTKQGYCEQFASAMALMARTAGISARVATGFATGDASGDGQFQVTMRHAHAWAELYFGQYGWLPFDPAPDRVERSPFIALRPGQEYLSWRPFGQLRVRLPNVVVGGAAFCGIALLLVAPIRRGLWAYRRRRLDWSDGSTPAGKVSIAYAQACQELARVGFRRPAPATPWEFGRALEQRLAGSRLDVAGAMRELTRLVVAACYSPEQISPPQVLRAQALLAFVRGQVRLAAQRRRGRG